MASSEKIRKRLERSKKQQAEKGKRRQAEKEKAYQKQMRKEFMKGIKETLGFSKIKIKGTKFPDPVIYKDTDKWTWVPTPTTFTNPCNEISLSNS